MKSFLARLILPFLTSAIFVQGKLHEACKMVSSNRDGVRSTCKFLQALFPSKDFDKLNKE